MFWEHQEKRMSRNLFKQYETYAYTGINNL
jgi:hypothetical protein